MGHAPGFAERRLRELFARAGITPGGENPCDPQIHDPRVYRQVLLSGSIGLGDSYVEGAWDCAALDDFFFRIMRAGLRRRPGMGPVLLARAARALVLNGQSRRRARKLAHYDLGNGFFARMLDRRMIYTCAYWAHADDLDTAQEAKLDLVCRKLGLRPGMHLLDIGCGWGGFMQFAAERYGVRCTGVTLSAAQASLARERCAGLPIEIQLRDYRDIEGRYDAIASIGMFEAVGRRNHRHFMEVCRRSLAPQGLLLLHTIGARGSGILESADPWLSTRIFPEGELPGPRQIVDGAEGLFTIEDWHNFGADYDRTLMAWHARFSAARNECRDRYGEAFCRMWSYYLLCCAGLFRARGTQLWQVVFSRTGVAGATGRCADPRGSTRPRHHGGIVDHDLGAVQVPRFIGQQEQHRGSDVLGLAEAVTATRKRLDLGAGSCLLPRRHLDHHRGLHPVRMHGIAPHVVLRLAALHGHRLGE